MFKTVLNIDVLVIEIYLFPIIIGIGACHLLFIYIY